MAARREYEMQLTLAAKLSSNYGASFKQAQAEMAAMQRELQAFNQVQKDISAYQKQQSALESTKAKLSTLQQQHDNIQREIDETNTFSSSLENRLLSKQLQIERTSASIDAQTAKLNQMGDALRSAGMNTDDLAAESQQLAQQIDALKEKQEEAAEAADEFGNAGSSAALDIQQALAAAGIAAALKEIYEYLAACAEASMEFESAMTGVAKTTDMSDAELAAMSESIKQLSTEIPVTTSELAQVAEAAGQLGIAKDDLLDFSTTMSMLSTATTMTADEAATMLAQFANITQMDASYYDELASTIVDLGNNFATTEQKITEMSQGIAASASLAGMSEADMVALSAAVTSLGIETQAGSTAMSKLISELMLAVETGESLEEFASIAGMSAEQFSRAWGEDAVLALQSFVVGLQDTERNGQSAASALNELGITEARMQRMVLSLAGSGDLLNRTLATADQAWNENTALVTEAEKRYATTQSQLTMMQNSYNNLQVAIGDGFTPVLQDVYAISSDVMDELAVFVSANPGLVRAVTAVGAVLGVAGVALALFAARAKIAAAASVLFSASIPGLNIILGVTAAVAGLAAAVAALGWQAEDEANEIRNLSEASREQYFELQALKAEYEETCEAMGETSYEAQSLQWQIEQLTEEYESNKQSLEEFSAQVAENIAASQEVVQSYQDATAEIETQERSTIALIDKLAELASQNDNTAASQAKMSAIIDALNESLPELNLNYEDVIANGTDFAESLKAMAEAEAMQRRYNKAFEDSVSLMMSAANLEADQEEATSGLAAAQERLAAAREAAAQYTWDAANNPSADGTMGPGYVESLEELQAATEAVAAYETALEDVNAAIAENNAALEECNAVLDEYSAVVSGEADSTAALNSAIEETTGKIAELTAAYEEAYNAALSSLEGQYSLWDTAADVVATDAEAMNAALESQIGYWQSYNANLASLSDRSADIQGLSDMMASFADGSSESVNAVAGMATATDEELRAMVQNWQALKAEQETTAGSLADLETAFSASLANLQTEFSATVAEMDLSDEAEASGRNTVQGFIDSAYAMLPDVDAAYEKVGTVAIDALNRRLEIHSPSRVAQRSGDMTVTGFNESPARLEAETRAAYAHTADVAVGALTYRDRPNSGYSMPDPASAPAEGGSSEDARTITIQLQPIYQISGASGDDVTEKLRQHDTELVALIKEVIDDLDNDSKRTRY